MATLRMVINGVTATRTIDDARAQNIVTLIYEHQVLPEWREDVPVPNTPQARLQAVVDWLALFMRDSARRYRRSELLAAQDAANRIELDAIDV